MSEFGTHQTKHVDTFPVSSPDKFAISTFPVISRHFSFALHHLCLVFQGRKLFFEDGVSRIDYILSWSTKKEVEVDEKKDKKDAAEFRKKRALRETFEKNLEIEGLKLEYDIKVRMHAKAPTV